MFEELNRLSGWSLKAIPENEIILISDKNADGTFLLHHFISMYLKADATVILLTAAQSFVHYNLTCARLGVNLDRSKTEGKLHVLDLLNASLAVHLNESNAEDVDNLSRALKEFSMRYIYKEIKTKVNADSTTIVILDDISLLSSIGFSINDLTSFVHYMTVLSRTNKFSFVTFFHQNTASVTTKPSLFLNCLSYSTCDLLVQGLDSGYCRDVHGNLVLTRKTKEIGAFPVRKEMQFRLTDRNLHLFAPGTSSAVL